MLVGYYVGLGDADGAAAGGLAPGTARIVHPQRDDFHAIAMAMNVIGNRPLGAKRRGEHKADLALLHNVGGAVALAGFRARIGHQRHAECGAIEVRSLARVAHVELNVVGAFERQKIAVAGQRFGSGMAMRMVADVLMRTSCAGSGGGSGTGKHSG